MVRKELKDKICVADTDTFLSQILPVATKDVDTIFQRLTNTNSRIAYDGARWTAFPADQFINKEAHLYDPIAAAANQVLDACRAPVAGSDITVKMENLHWRVQPDKAPTSLDDYASLIRPDIVASLSKGSDDKAVAENETRLLEQANGKKLSRAEREELSDELSVWWLRVHVPVEVKYKDNEQEMRVAVDQLCNYMKSVLAEQLDRRFVIGLAICKYKLTVWLCDRSGLIGTKTHIDIHKEPKKFIHVLMGLSCLEPARLGWDPTMKIGCKGTKGIEYRLSTSADVLVEHFGKTAYETKWAIFLPKEDGSTEGEWYVTVRALSIVRAAMMTGRATLVWLVTKIGENERFVLKQTWRPENVLTEAQFREFAPPESNLCEIVRSVNIGGDISNQASVVVDTRHYVRRGVDGMRVDPDSLLPPNAESQSKKRNAESEMEETALVVVPATVLDTAARRTSRRAGFIFTSRMQTRTLMSTYGWPVKFFRDVRELVGTIRNAIEGHQDLWFGGVLHRDVSVGNILICPEDNGGRKTRGRLIDLDYSKRTADKDAPVSTHTSEMTDDVPSAEKVATTIGVAGLCGASIDEPAALALLLRYSGEFETSLTYIQTFLIIYPHLRHTSRPLSKEDLRLYDMVRAPPRENHHSQTPEKTGTKAFMSAEVLTNQPNWQNRTRGPEKYINGRIFHSAIHDLESFFWVLVYLCLTRAGPGGEHRDPPEDSKAHAQLDNIVACLFTSDDYLDIARNKHDLFESPEDLQDYIIPHFHPYFQCLSDLVLDWWNALQLAYRTYDALTPGFIHQQVLDVLDNAMKNLPDPVPSKEMEREDNRRTTDLDSTATKPPSWGSSPSRKSELKSGSYRELTTTTTTSPTPSPQKKKARVHTSDSLVGPSR
ncbi:hypothetical protein DENSPDRAFT_933622 [Dentipellis sp. KUC8613]|nr:hypothetical protein DENSPDRAFT_933622 [Dentipellis sp. KUC8613]